MVKADVQVALRMGCELYYVIFMPYFSQLRRKPGSSYWRLLKIGRDNVVEFGDVNVKMKNGDLVPYAGMHEDCWKAIYQEYSEKLRQVELYRADLENMHDEILEIAEKKGYLVKDDESQVVTAVIRRSG